MPAAPSFRDGDAARVAEAAKTAAAKKSTPTSKAGTARAPGGAFAFAGNKWHAKVKAQIAVLEEMGKFKEADLDQWSLKSLKMGRTRWRWCVWASSPMRRVQSAT